jgi:hypothetical protein
MAITVIELGVHHRNSLYHKLTAYFILGCIAGVKPLMALPGSLIVTCNSGIDLDQAREWLCRIGYWPGSRIRPDTLRIRRSGWLQEFGVPAYLPVSRQAWTR